MELAIVSEVDHVSALLAVEQQRLFAHGEESSHQSDPVLVSVVDEVA
jgi:hypothetical protein